MKAYCLLLVIGNVIFAICTILEIEKQDNDQFPLVTLPINKYLNSYEMTFCLKFFIDENQEAFLFSTPFHKLALYLNIKSNYPYGFGYHGNISMIFNIPAGAVWPFEWFHLCFIHNNNEYQIVTNGIIWDNKQILEDYKNLDHFSVDKIAIGSSFDNERTFHGRISGLNIWNYSLSVEDLKDLTSSCKKEFQKTSNILDWNTTRKEQFSILRNEAIRFIAEDEAMCSSTNKLKLKLILGLFDFFESQHICRIMNAEMYIPTGKREVEKILNDSSQSPLYKKCINNMILPIYQTDDGKFKDNFKRDIPNNLKWHDGEPNGDGQQRCVHMSTQFAISDYFCSSQGCPICKWNKNPVFILKGLCPLSKIEYRYVMRVNKLYHGVLTFQGFTNDYYITYHKDKDTWIILKADNHHWLDQIKPIKNDTIEGTLSTYDGFLPVGLKAWKLNEDVCDQKNVNLKFTMVRIFEIKIHTLHVTISII